GEPGTRVTITVETPGDKESRRTVELVRAKISIEPVTTTLQEVEGRRIVHARLVTFQRNTAQKLIEGLKAHRPVHGVVLDVRDNPGGLLSAAVRISAAFLARGPIVSTVGQSGKTLMTFKAEDAHEGHEWLRNPSLPVVVLINKGSASASEIVAGVLQDRGRAVLIGGQSFGKGSVQSIVKLTEGRALKLTTARYRLPSGRLIDGIGLVPDLRAEQDGELPLALEVIRSWARLRGVDPLEVPEG
ncbi:MAG: carboxyl-terminal processing protease, partial [Myxococcota bacterium]